jgi:hypothetical protein
MIFYGVTQPGVVTKYDKYAGLVNSSIGSLSVEKTGLSISKRSNTPTKKPRFLKLRLVCAIILLNVLLCQITKERLESPYRIAKIFQQSDWYNIKVLEAHIQNA